MEEVVKDQKSNPMGTISIMPSLSTPQLSQRVSNAKAKIKPAGNALKCPECERPFTVVSKLNFHLKVKHKIIVHYLDVDNQKEKENFTDADKRSVYSTAKTETLEREPQLRRSIMNLILSPSMPILEPQISVNSALSTSDGFSFSTSSSPSASSAEASPSNLPQYHIFNWEGLVAQPPSPPPPLPVPTVVNTQRSQREMFLMKCPVCERTFHPKHNKQFKNHLEVHEGKKPFVCPYCTFGYESEIQLLEHVSRTHMNNSAFECETCGRSYKTHRGLKNHQILKHQQ